MAPSCLFGTRRLANRLAGACLGVMALLWLAIPAQAEPTEAQIKTAYLYNFAKFIEWPDTISRNRFSICIEGNSEIVEAVSSLEGKSVGSLPVKVRYVANIQDIGDCHILFLDQGWIGPFDPSISRRVGLLTVGTGIEFANAGGAIGLFFSDRKMRFAINVETAAAALLRINSRLLNLAHIVRR